MLITADETLNHDPTAVHNQIDADLQASNARFRGLFDNMTLGVVYQDAEGRITLANPAAEQILGLSLDQMQGRTSVDPRWQAVREDGSAFPGEEHPGMIALRTGKIVTDVLMGVYHPQKNEQRWIRIAAVPEFRPGETEPFRVFATFDDITERRRVEQALVESEMRYRQALNATRAVPYALDYTTGRYDMDLADFKRFTGVSVDEMTYQVFRTNLAESIPRGQFVGLSHTEAVARARRGEGGLLWQCDHCVRTPDGGERWISDEAIQILDENGVPKGSIGILQDITERKQAEVALRTSEKRYRLLTEELEQHIQERTVELQAQRDFARQVMDALGQGLVVGDDHGRAAYANSAMASLLEMEQAALIGCSLSDFTHPDDMERVRQLFPRRRYDEMFEFELRLISATGAVKYVLISTSPLRESDKIIGRIAVFTDLTSIKEVEHNLRQSHDELSAANHALGNALRMKDEFLASMSHELRTPLTGILGLSEALQMQTYGPVNERQLRSLETIWESGRHLLALINDILDLSKLAASQLELTIETCDVNDICQSSLALVRGMAAKKRQQVAFELSPDAMTVRADPRRLKQMLANLLTNAVKFTPEGGQLGLSVHGDAAQQVVRFAVWDKGIGIAAANLPQLFQPFTQLDSRLARRYEGTGLGLALVQRMVQLHGGDITVESEIGAGSTFTLSLPWG